MGSKSTRTTVTLPPGLKERMDAVSDQVNWSGVAAAAFERKLVEIAAKLEPTNMDKVFAQLRESEKDCVEEDTVAGRDKARQWVASAGQAKQLRRLAAWYQNLPDEMDWEEGDAYGIAHHILSIMNGERPDRRESEAFWEEALGERYPKGALLEGFVVGSTLR